MSRIASTLLLALLPFAAATRAPAQEDPPRPLELVQEIDDRLRQIELQLHDTKTTILRQMGVLDELARAADSLHDDPPMTGRDAARGHLREARRKAALEPPLGVEVDRVLDACERVLDRGAIGAKGEELARELLQEVLPLEHETLGEAGGALELAIRLRTLSDRVAVLGSGTERDAAIALKRLYALHDWTLDAR